MIMPSQNRISYDCNNRLTEEGGKHGESRDSEVMLAAQPSCYLIGSFTKGFGKLLFIQAPFTHESVKSVRDGKRKSCFLPLLPRNLIENFL